MCTRLRSIASGDWTAPDRDSLAMASARLRSAASGDWTAPDADSLADAKARLRSAASGDCTASDWSPAPPSTRLRSTASGDCTEMDALPAPPGSKVKTLLMRCSTVYAVGTSLRTVCFDIFLPPLSFCVDCRAETGGPHPSPWRGARQCLGTFRAQFDGSASIARRGRQRGRRVPGPLAGVRAAVPEGASRAVLADAAAPLRQERGRIPPRRSGHALLPHHGRHGEDQDAGGGRPGGRDRA